MSIVFLIVYVHKRLTSNIMNRTSVHPLPDRVANTVEFRYVAGLAMLSPLTELARSHALPDRLDNASLTELARMHCWTAWTILY